LRENIYKNCAKVYAIGEARKRIKNCWGEIVIDCENLQNAVETAAKTAKTGDAVVLSPACASFDQFSGFEDRGEKFKKAVKEL
jgi:UDP-N-acetylmuramoylalanine--D-glutamate ligase